MSSVNSNQFAHMFQEVFGAAKITKTEANAQGLDVSKVDSNLISAQTAYEDKDMQEYVIAQYNADFESLDEIPEEEEDIKPAEGGSKADA